uniref:Uncharacterized protein n=1 Tax=Arion vulgaris TaxID=1028688 RepID=A0A0B6YA14_9EUPU
MSTTDVYYSVNVFTSLGLLSLGAKNGYVVESKNCYTPHLKKLCLQPSQLCLLTYVND